MSAGEPLRPLVTAWLGKINLAIKAKQPFDEIGEQCMSFFSGTMDWFWKPEFQKRYVGGGITPKFRIALAKAFELVALFGPVLYHRNPTRRVQPYQPIAAPPEFYGDVQNDPMAQQFFQQEQQAMQQEYAANTLRCQLMERYLSFTPREQPNGGLEQAAEDAITETLIKGRGILVPEAYDMPTGQRLTGCFYDSVDNWLIDPDSRSWNFGEAKWIARRCVHPVWEVAREYGIPEEDLKKAATDESASAQAWRKADKWGEKKRQEGTTFDLCTYYKIWSLGGVGTRIGQKTKNAFAEQYGEAFDEIVGDYAYLAILPGYPAPLNCPKALFETADDEGIQQAFAWPVPYWKDRRWPCAELSFYRAPNSAWSLSPLAPGLGELTALNIIISNLVHRVWTSTRDFMAVLASAAEQVEEQYKKGGNFVYLKLKDGMYKNISECIQFLQHPPVNSDIWQIIDALFGLFDRRVGLSDLLYGMQGAVQSRSATDVKTREEKLSVRPDHMAKRVEKWMSESARMEKLCAYYTGVSGESIRPLVGPVGARMWDQLVAQADEATVLSEMDCTVEANSVRKPNKDRDIDNANALMQIAAPELSKHADITGDTTQLNNLWSIYGQSIEQDVSGLMMGQRLPPPPPPEVAQQQQQMADMQAQQMQQEMALKQMEMQGKQIDAQNKAVEGQQKAAQSQQQMLMDALSGQQELAQDQQVHRQEMKQDQQRHKQEMQQAREKLAFQQAQARLQRLQKNRQATKP